MVRSTITKFIFILVTPLALLFASCKTQSANSIQPPPKIIIEVVHKISGLTLILQNPDDPIKLSPIDGFYINDHGEIYAFLQEDYSKFPKKSGILTSHNQIFNQYGDNLFWVGTLQADQLDTLHRATLNIDVEQFIEEPSYASDSSLLTYRIHTADDENEFLYRSTLILETCDNFHMNTSPSAYEIISTLETIILEHELEGYFRPNCGYDIMFDELMFKVMSDENLSMTITLPEN